MTLQLDNSKTLVLQAKAQSFSIKFKFPDFDKIDKCYIKWWNSKNTPFQIGSETRMVIVISFFQHYIGSPNQQGKERKDIKIINIRKE